MKIKLIGAEAIAEALGMSVGNLYVHRAAGRLDRVVKIEDGRLVASPTRCANWRRRWLKTKKRGRPLVQGGWS